MTKIKPDILSAVANNILELTLLPTEQCNFRCTYCYEDFDIGKMPDSVITGVKHLIYKRIEELDWLKLEWFGGEPLANLPAIIAIAGYAKHLAENNNCRFTSAMTTNGYLLKPSVFEKLLSVGVTSYQISLDGPEHLHNETRLRADGAGTFARIWQHLEQMADTDHHFHVMLRVHVTPENYTELPALIEKINQRFMGDKRFSIFLKAIVNLGGPNGGKFATLEGQTHTDIMQHLSSLIKTEEMKLGEESPYICYAAKTNSLVVRANGRIAKCTVAFSDDRNDLGHINENGTLELDQDKLQPWVRGLISQEAGALGCPLHGLPVAKKKNPLNEANRIPALTV